MELEDFFRDSRINSYISWFLTLILASALLESIADFDILWSIFSAVILCINLLPALSYRNLKVMLPWEIVLLGSIPVIVRSLGISAFSSQVATFTSMAALALMIAIELQMFTKIRFNHSFAVLFTVIATLAIAGLWAITRYMLGAYTGNSYLTTNDALMAEFMNATIAGFIAGILFDSYFKRRGERFRKIIRGMIRR
ncbi:MAG: hypothetical protein V5A72_01425 [Candidatus Nanohaloarchaea archaeon]